jgi:hypothetical protein
MMQQLAMKGTYQQGMFLPEQPIVYEQKTDVILVFPLQPDASFLFENVQNEEMQLFFKHPIKAKLSAEEDMLFLQYPELEITAYGQDVHEVIQHFQDVFIATFEHYTSQPDQQLTKEAQRLKVALFNLVAQKSVVKEETV